MIETELRLAVIDDDVSVRESLPDLLRQFGYVVTAFSSAQEFLSSGRLGDFHCLILDIAMPRMSGPELRRELVARGHDVPVVFITAYADSNARSMLHQQGAAEVLIKPFSVEALLRALKAALQ